MSGRVILALELSTPRGQLAVLRGSDILLDELFVSDRSHNSMLYGPLQRALSIARPELIVVGTGPGSYTGVRIAIAAAQGIGLSTGAPVIGWSSLATLCSESHYTVIGDARRGIAYHATVTNGRLSPLTILPVAELPTDLAQPRYTVDTTPLASVPELYSMQPSALRLAQIASGLSEPELSQLQAQLLEPLYVQEAFVTQPKRPK
jgi:tRNA threonylcarbamoyladenosine biosynthesis protein TsaB